MNTWQNFEAEAKRQTESFPVPVGFELVMGGRGYQYVRMNDQGIPYFKRILRSGRLSQKTYTVGEGWTTRLWLIDTYRRHNGMTELEDSEYLQYKV